MVHHLSLAVLGPVGGVSSWQFASDRLTGNQSGPEVSESRQSNRRRDRIAAGSSFRSTHNDEGTGALANAHTIR
jgi:hypothetical protein